MIIAVTNLKGGVGKSTITRTLAVYFAKQGIKVCILDTDLEQKTSCDWFERRPEDAVRVPVVPMTTVQNLQRDVKTHLQDGYKMVIIDGVPQLSDSATKTIALADLLIVPVVPSFDDVLSFKRFIERYEQVKVLRDEIPAFTVMNMFTGRNNEDLETREVMKAFEKYGIKPMKAFLENRIAHRRQTKYGLTVLDTGAEDAIERQIGKARAEATVFCEEVENLLMDILKSKKNG
jgi:chromosome partitioning protein